MRIAHERDERSEDGGSGRDRSVEVGARVLEVGARFAEGVDQADTIVKLAIKVRQGRVGSASVLHERLSPNVGVDGLLQVREVGDSRHEQPHHRWGSGARSAGEWSDGERSDAKLNIQALAKGSS